MPDNSTGKPRPSKPPGRARRNPDQLSLGDRPVAQAELFEEQPGGKQPAARLRQISESMEAIDSLFHEAIQARGVRVMDEFLEFVRRFNRFSAFNVMLMEMQRPGATAIGSRDQWFSIGRRIKPGAVPIAILWPFAPVRWVYELNDTYGREVPPHTTDPFAVKGAPPGSSWSATLDSADRRGIRVELTDRWGGNLPHHYALLPCPAEIAKRQAIDQRLAEAHITPLWYPEGGHEHVEQILQLLVE